MGRLTLTFQDEDEELSISRFPSANLSDLNIADQLIAATTLCTAIGGVSLCNLNTRSHLAEELTVTPGAAADGNARREAKALVKYHNAVTLDKHSLEVPGPDMNKKNSAIKGMFYVPGSADNHADWDAFVAAFEAFVKQGPSFDQAVVIDEIVDVGRNN